LNKHQTAGQQASRKTNHKKADDKTAQKLINKTQHVKNSRTALKIAQLAQTHLACAAAFG